MAISRYSVREKAKALAQDAGPGDDATGVQLLLTWPGDYNLAILQALRIFTGDRPNVRVVQPTVAAAGFRLVLSGSGVLPGLVGVNAWVDGFSALQQLFRQWNPASQNPAPMDPNTYRVVNDPDDVVILELLDQSAAAGEVVRLEFTAPHQLTESETVVAAPAAAPAVALASPAAPGNVDDGTHTWKFTYVTAQGETTPSPSAGLTVADKTVNGQVKVTIPAADPGQGVTAARVYRQVAGSTGDWLLVGTLTADHGGGIFTDNVADASLGAAAPVTNTAGGVNTVRAGDEDALAALAASLILQLAANKAVQNTGNTGLPNDVVDRRSQSDQFRSRAKELRDWYNAVIGKSADNLAPGSAVKDLDVDSPSGIGFLWHSKARR